MRPPKPSVRSVSAAFAPASEAPTTTMVCCSALMARPPRGEVEELLPGAGVVADHPAQGRGDGPGAGLLAPPQRHAQVLGLEDHAHAERIELPFEPVGDLRRQALLDLERAREQLDDAAQLAQADD